MRKRRQIELAAALPFSLFDPDFLEIYGVNQKRKIWTINAEKPPFSAVFLRNLVRVTGFEPAASCSQSRRATNCATPGYLVFSEHPRVFPKLARYQLRYTRLFSSATSQSREDHAPSCAAYRWIIPKSVQKVHRNLRRLCSWKFFADFDRRWKNPGNMLK